ncbi:transporter substrate-binding domain-containing protein [Fundidesulfovibrio putealis]|uniref:transporter substrate-binding domain-containing protein n=1 Tax=Fundidesulfovibrio putealis TaxID=270496 RepID=UPI000414B23B|nr:transporter substrate-binding domain-containing protein [Fundidesulfovibrio putealis]
MKILLLLVAVVSFAVAPCIAGETLSAVKKNGVIRCGVGDNIPGMAMQDATGTWSGMDIDFCRAVSAAVLGDPAKCAYLPLASRARFTSLMSKEIDLLARNTTWTIGREAAFNVAFVGPLLFTRQAIAVRKEDASAVRAALDKAKIGVVRGSTHVRDIEEIAARTGLTFDPVLYDSTAQAWKGFVSGECRGVLGDETVLAAERSLMPDGTKLIEIIAQASGREPLSPATRQDDGQWTTVLRGVLSLLVAAEECGLTQANIADVANRSVAARQLLERAGALAKPLGIPPDWGVRVIESVGNYGEMFSRNLGAGSPLKLDRDLNRLWKDGGLIWAPPL